jgi:hypothetical protein
VGYGIYYDLYLSSCSVIYVRWLEGYYDDDGNVYMSFDAESGRFISSGRVNTVSGEGDGFETYVRQVGCGHVEGGAD